MYELTPFGFLVSKLGRKKGKQDVSCSITDTTVQYIYNVGNYSLFHTHTTNLPFLSLTASGEAVNES